MSAHEFKLTTYSGEVTGKTYHRANCVCGWKSSGYAGPGWPTTLGQKHVAKAEAGAAWVDLATEATT